MLNVVVDSSVAIKWVLPEVLQAEANALRELWDEGQIQCWAPSLLFAEIGSVFWKRARKNELSSDECLEAVGLLQSLPWNVTPIEALSEESLRLALVYDRTVYDSLYLALAARLDCDFVTADLRLANSLQGRFDKAKYLGDWKLGDSETSLPTDV
jgi:predicted nucleic acid-binding protein